MPLLPHVAYWNVEQVFINEGHLDRHIRRMRLRYDQRRQALIRALQQYLGKQIPIVGENVGLHLMVQLQTSLNIEAIVNQAARSGMELVSADSYYLCQRDRCEFIVGYANLSVEQITEKGRGVRGPHHPSSLTPFNGGDLVELAGDGIHLSHDARYAVTDEFLQVWRSLCCGEAVDFEGQHLTIRGGKLLFPPVQQPYPPWSDTLGYFIRVQSK